MIDPRIAAVPDISFRARRRDAPSAYSKYIPIRERPISHRCIFLKVRARLTRLANKVLPVFLARAAILPRFRVPRFVISPRFALRRKAPGFFMAPFIQFFFATAFSSMKFSQCFTVIHSLAVICHVSCLPSSYRLLVCRPLVILHFFFAVIFHSHLMQTGLHHFHLTTSAFCIHFSTSLLHLWNTIWLSTHGFFLTFLVTAAIT